MIKSEMRQSTLGLSPLARGTLAAALRSVLQDRFIPAGAGNTREAGILTEDGTVYPRWRGEHRYQPAVASMAAGLSPLARGTQNGIICAARLARFIPAGAGNTVVKPASISWRVVYPRWRGEHIHIS